MTCLQPNRWHVCGRVAAAVVLAAGIFSRCAAVAGALFRRHYTCDEEKSSGSWKDSAFLLANDRIPGLVINQKKGGDDYAVASIVETKTMPHVRGQRLKEVPRTPPPGAKSSWTVVRACASTALRIGSQRMTGPPLPSSCERRRDNSVTISQDADVQKANAYPPWRSGTITLRLWWASSTHQFT